MFPERSFKSREKTKKPGISRGKWEQKEKKGIDLFQNMCYNAENEHGVPGKTGFLRKRRVQMLDRIFGKRNKFPDT